MNGAPGLPRGRRVGDLKTAATSARGAEPRLGALDLPPGTPGGRPVAEAAVDRALARAEPGQWFPALTGLVEHGLHHQP